MASNTLELMEHVQAIQKRLNRLEKEIKATCYRCNEKGHYASTCNKKIDQPLTCFRCHEPGHFVAACPKLSNCSDGYNPNNENMQKGLDGQGDAANQTDVVETSETKIKKRKRTVKACKLIPEKTQSDAEVQIDQKTESTPRRRSRTVKVCQVISKSNAELKINQEAENKPKRRRRSVKTCKVICESGVELQEAEKQPKRRKRTVKACPEKQPSKKGQLCEEETILI